MRFPIQIEFFGQQFHLHFLFESLAFFVGIRLYYYLRKGTKDSISDMNRLWIMLGAMIGALFGSRILAVLENPETLTEINFMTFYQSKTVAGGFIGGLLGVELMKKCIGEEKSSGDLYVIPIIVALIIGRIGCFSMGIDEPVYGIPTVFFTGMNLGDGISRHPVVLYEIFFLIFLLLFFRFIKNIKLSSGSLFKLFMIFYFLYRFLVEFIKPYHSLFLGLSSIHWAAVLLFLYYSKFIFRFKESIIK